MHNQVGFMLGMQAQFNKHKYTILTKKEIKVI